MKVEKKSKFQKHGCPPSGNTMRGEPNDSRLPREHGSNAAIPVAEDQHKVMNIVGLGK